MEASVPPEVLAEIAAEFFEEFDRRFGSHIHILDWSLHLDEATPHIHERHVFDCENQGAITGKANVGGLFGGFLNGEHGYQGWSENTVTIDGCSSTGTVTGESDTGEIIGLDQIVR